MTVREAQYAGKFYAGTKEGLLREIRSCFGNREFGPDSVEKMGKGKAVGMIVPHAGYVFSGACAACAYHGLPLEENTTYIMLATNHTGTGRTSIAEKLYQTPLGVVETDTEGVEFLLKNSPLVKDQLAHTYEHSLEVQLPFLQFLHQKSKSAFKIIPIVVSSILNSEQIAEGLARMVKKHRERRFCFIASSDFTHQGSNYGYVPFEEKKKENISMLDHGAIEHILKLDSGGFHHYLQKTGATICGYLPIILLLKTMKKVAKVEGKLLKYYTSGDVAGDYENSVSYAAIVFYEKRA